MTGAMHRETYIQTRLRRGAAERLVTVERWNAVSKTYWVRVYASHAASPADEPLETSRWEMSSEAAEIHRVTVQDLAERGYVPID